MWQHARTIAFWVLILIMVPIGFSVWSQLVPALPATIPPGFDIGEMIRNFQRPWSTSHGVIAAGIVFILSRSVPKEPLKWLRPSLFFVAVLIALATFVFSEYAMRLSYEIEKNENCVAHKDCGPRAEDIPTVNGGTVKVPRSGSITVRVTREAAFEGHIGESLDFSGTSICETEWIKGTRLILFTPKEGERVVTVTSVPREQTRLSSRDEC